MIETRNTSILTLKVQLMRTDQDGEAGGERGYPVLKLWHSFNATDFFCS